MVLPTWRTAKTSSSSTLDPGSRRPANGPALITRVPSSNSGSFSVSVAALTETSQEWLKSKIVVEISGISPLAMRADHSISNSADNAPCASNTHAPGISDSLGKAANAASSSKYSRPSPSMSFQLNPRFAFTRPTKKTLAIKTSIPPPAKTLRVNSTSSISSPVVTSSRSPKYSPSRKLPVSEMPRVSKPSEKSNLAPTFPPILTATGAGATWKLASKGRLKSKAGISHCNKSTVSPVNNLKALLGSERIGILSPCPPLVAERPSLLNVDVVLAWLPLELLDELI